jgi:replicative DNA helicase
MGACINLKLLLTDEKDIDLISSKIRYWVFECGVKCVFIDFLTMLRVSEEKAKYWNDRQRVNYILQVLTDLNRKCNIPIILYAQLNRALLQRASKEPNLGDLKESGSIEELAFQISFLHRPEYYDESGVDELGESIKGLMYQIIAKHRDGMLDRIKYQSVLKSSKLLPWNSYGVPAITETNATSWDGKNILLPYNNQQPRNVSADDSWPTMDENKLF